MFTTKFWRRASERACKSAAQSAVLAIGADQINALQADWVLVAGFAVGGFVLSLLTSMASTPVGDDPESPSVVD